MEFHSSPATPLPAVFDVKKRIQQLRSFLDPKHPHYEPEQQHVNINAAIKLYEDGELDGSQTVYLLEGKIVTKESSVQRTRLGLV
jgi:hypothetical protein